MCRKSTVWLSSIKLKKNIRESPLHQMFQDHWWPHTVCHNHHLDNTTTTLTWNKHNANFRDRWFCDTGQICIFFPSSNGQTCSPGDTVCYLVWLVRLRSERHRRSQSHLSLLNLVWHVSSIRSQVPEEEVRAGSVRLIRYAVCGIRTRFAPVLIEKLRKEITYFSSFFPHIHLLFFFV